MLRVKDASISLNFYTKVRWREERGRAHSCAVGPLFWRAGSGRYDEQPILTLYCTILCNRFSAWNSVS